MQHGVISAQQARKMQNKENADHRSAGSSSENHRSIPENKIKKWCNMIFYTFVNDKDIKIISTRWLRARAHTHTGTHTQVPHVRTSTLVRTHILVRAHTQYMYCVCIDSVSKIHYQLKHCQYLVSVHDHCVLFSNTVLCDSRTHALTHT